MHYMQPNVDLLQGEGEAGGAVSDVVHGYVQLLFTVKTVNSRP